RDLEQSESELKKVDERLSGALQHLSAHINNSPMAVIEFDPQFRVIRWSKEAEKIFGWTLEEVKGRSVFEMRWVYEEDEDLVRRVSAGLLNGDKSCSVNVNRNYRKDGSVIHCEWYNSGIYNPDGELISILSQALDITERKKNELSLLESEERFRKIFEETHLGIVITSPSFVFEKANPAFCRMMGYSEEEILSMTFADITHPDHLEKDIENVKKVGRGETPFYQTVKRYISKSGKVLWGNLVVSGIYDEYGALRYFLSIVTDITGRKQMEEHLRENEAMMRYIIKHDPNAIAVYDRNLRYIAVSDRYLLDYNIRESDITGRHHYDVFPEMPKRWKDVHTRCLAGAIERNDDDYFERPDGSITYNRWECRPWYKSDGEIGGIITYTEVTTERKNAELALRKSEQQFRLLFENMAEGVALHELIHDDAGNAKNYRILKVNRAYEMQTGISSERACGSLAGELYGTDTPPYLEEFTGVAHSGVPLLFETYFEPLGKHLIISVIPNERGQFATVFMDITERKSMEEELLKADKLESVGLLAGGIAHDFNNILTSILGNISMAKIQVKSGRKVFDLLSAAETATMMAQGLTRQLLTFSKGGVPVKETASISNLIKESSVFVLRGSKSECEFSIAEDLWPVDADLGQISQVISNIVINANQSMPEGGLILITAENMTPENMNGIPVKPERYIRITVKDQGVGIPEKYFSKIFDPYFTTKQAGSGLGLATAYSIINKHNGHISVNSSPGAGTAFNIYLPASGKEIPEKEEAVLLTGRGRILMMDDDVLLKEMAEEMLDMLGYDSAFAKDGAEAVKMYKKAMKSKKPYDAVILDLTIPGGMGGKEAIKILLEMDPEVKAIVFSGYSEGEIMSNYLEYGFKSMMPKPFDSYALGKVLSEVLKGGKPLKEN
ncbi:MAG: two-component system, cell cycle sensor histidine kinase and response regulator CckA, partial [Thermodesulfobacteriota bacterium]|nr:two-component system, cell cycle sensor histidine kinase and response regulator CckA [Thermodesulfobacteriota bacterium]